MQPYYYGAQVTSDQITGHVVKFLFLTQIMLVIQGTVVSALQIHEVF